MRILLLLPLFLSLNCTRNDAANAGNTKSVPLPGMNHELRGKPIEYWKERLSKEEISVCREGGTERPSSSHLNKSKAAGTYICSSCGAELFSSQAKFDSGTGWPSFSAPTKEEALELLEDKTLGMTRTEVRCRHCGAHLGHVFDDGPPPTGKRYCINGACLRFRPQAK